MAYTYRALALLLSYPNGDTAAAMPAVMDALSSERLVPAAMVQRLAPLADELASADLYDAQARYVDLFDRSRSLSLSCRRIVTDRSTRRVLDADAARTQLLRASMARS